MCRPGEVVAGRDWQGQLEINYLEDRIILGCGSHVALAASGARVVIGAGEESNCMEALSKHKIGAVVSEEFTR